jgi:hypothetical protein
MLTGLTKPQMETILQESKSDAIWVRRSLGKKWPNILLFVLIFARHYPVYAFLAWIFNISVSTAFDYVKVGREVLLKWASPLISKGDEHSRKLYQIRILGRTITGVMDGKEQKCVTSLDKHSEARCYSGKYTDNTVCLLAVCNPVNGKVWYLSKSMEGSKNDINLFETNDWSFLRNSDETLLADKGFAKSDIVLTKHRKRRGHRRFSDQEKEENALIDKHRIIIENFFARAGKWAICRLPFRAKSTSGRKPPIEEWWTCITGLFNRFFVLRAE